MDPQVTGADQLDPSLTQSAGGAPEAENVEVKIEQQDPEEGVDYNKIYEGLQEQFNKAYSLSQTLFVTEKTQRQALNYYKRRKNALTDFLADLEASDDDIDMPLQINPQRIANLIALKPDLEPTLRPLLHIAAGTDPLLIALKPTYGVDLTTEELIPDLPNDDLDSVENNPQDTEMWTRRNYSHLVNSKFKPAEIRPKGVRDYFESPSLNSKRRKRPKEA